MKPCPAETFGDAEPVCGRGHGRTEALLLAIAKRNALICDAAKFFTGRDREVARQLIIALSRYRCGRWRRDRCLETCPAQHEGKLVEVLFWICKDKDADIGDRTIRRVLASTRGPKVEV